MIPGIVAAAAVAGGVTDPDFASTVLLLSCDGSPGSTTFTDESAAARGAATPGGNAQVSATAKFGSGGLLLDGSGDLISYADHADWTLGSSEFTIETWARFDAAGIDSSQILISHYSATSNQRGWALQYRGDLATNQLWWVTSPNGSSAAATIAVNWTPSAATWYHICIERSGDTWRLYVDGVMIASVTTAITLFNSNQALRIGVSGDGNYFNGILDEIRITLGVARYASDGGFTPPAAAYPRS